MGKWVPERGSAEGRGNNSMDGSDWEDEYLPRQMSTGRGQQRRNAQQAISRGAGRARPTNNQLLYKAYCRWNHYSGAMPGAVPSEIEACASVTAAFLKVLEIMQRVEMFQTPPRNILQILSTNTRRTKVVELSSGTHRIPDELKKHNLSDGYGGQYSTNLDRNRYGNDDQYLFTVIRYNLETLGLCPCLIDVEIIDAKANNESLMVSSGVDACICSKAGVCVEAPVSEPVTEPPLTRPKPLGFRPAKSRRDGVGGLHQSAASDRSHSEGSQLFDALVMAATGGTDDALAKDEPTEDFQAQSKQPNGALPLLRTHSPMFNAAPEVGNLQNALDAYRQAEDGFEDDHGGSARGRGRGMFGRASSRFGSGRGRMSRLGSAPPLDRDHAVPSVNTNDLQGLSSLGASGVAVGITGYEKGDEEVKLQEVNQVNLQPAGSVQSHEGDTDERDRANVEVEAERDDENDQDYNPDNPIEQDTPTRRQRFRHIARQSSSLNLNGNRAVHGEVRRLSYEMQQLRQKQDQIDNDLAARSGSDGDHSRLGKMERDLATVKQQISRMLAANEEANKRADRLAMELAKSQQQSAALFKLLHQSLLNNPQLPHSTSQPPPSQPPFTNASSTIPSLFAASTASPSGSASPYFVQNAPNMSSAPHSLFTSQPHSSVPSSTELPAGFPPLLSAPLQRGAQGAASQPPPHAAAAAGDGSGGRRQPTTRLDDAMQAFERHEAQEKEAMQLEATQYDDAIPSRKRGQPDMTGNAQVKHEQEHDAFGRNTAETTFKPSDSIEMLKGLPDMSHIGSLSDLQSLFSLNSQPADDKRGGNDNEPMSRMRHRNVPHANHSFSYASPFNAEDDAAERAHLTDDAQGGLTSAHARGAARGGDDGEFDATAKLHVSPLDASGGSYMRMHPHHDMEAFADTIGGKRPAIGSPLSNQQFKRRVEGMPNGRQGSGQVATIQEAGV